jgi:hypothetical protein
LDKIHGKVKNIEQNLKTFKLKSRTAYEQLVDEEDLLADELESWAEKFEQYALEKIEHKEALAAISSTRSKRPQSLSNNNRLLTKQNSIGSLR